MNIKLTKKCPWTIHWLACVIVLEHLKLKSTLSKCASSIVDELNFL